MRISDWSSDVCSSDLWLAEILYGLLTGNYRRVAEIHFEAQYVPAHHDVAEFATALRAVGEPMRGKPVKELSVGQMLDGLFAITRDFDMQTQPHLLLLQKTMVMVEGVANRSEEHTSELQSLMRISYAVFCLKKKRKKN